MLPKFTNLFGHFPRTASHGAGSGFRQGFFNSTAQSASTGSTAGGAGGAKYNAGSRFYSYNGYTGAGRAVTQANGLTNDDDRHLNPRLQRLAIAPRRTNAYPYHSHTPRLRRNSTSTATAAEVEHDARKAIVEEPVPPNFTSNDSRVWSETSTPTVQKTEEGAMEGAVEMLESDKPTDVAPEEIHSSTLETPETFAPEIEQPVLQSASELGSPTQPDPPLYTEQNLADSPTSAFPSRPSSSLTLSEIDALAELEHARNTMGYNDLLVAYRTRRPDIIYSAVSHFRTALKPSEYTTPSYNMALTALIATRLPDTSLDGILEVYNEMVQRGAVPNGRTYRIMISVLCTRDAEIEREVRDIEARMTRRELWASSFKGADSPSSPDSSTGNLLGLSGQNEQLRDADRISSLRKESAFSSALILFQSSVSTAFHKRGLPMGVYIGLLRSCAAHGAVDAAIRVFAHLERFYGVNAPEQSSKPSTSPTAYLPSFTPTHAFGSKSKPYDAIYQFLLSTYGSAGDIKGAREVFTEYLKQSSENNIGTPPSIEDTASYQSFRRTITLDNGETLTRSGRSRVGQIAIWNEMIKTCFEIGVAKPAHLSALLASKKLNTKARAPTRVTPELAAETAAEALSLLERMMDTPRGLDYMHNEAPLPNAATYSQVIVGFLERGDIDTAWEWFTRMVWVNPDETSLETGAMRKPAPEIHAPVLEPPLPVQSVWIVMMNTLAKEAVPPLVPASLRLKVESKFPSIAELVEDPKATSTPSEREMKQFRAALDKAEVALTRLNQTWEWFVKTSENSTHDEKTKGVGVAIRSLDRMIVLRANTRWLKASNDVELWGSDADKAKQLQMKKELAEFLRDRVVLFSSRRLDAPSLLPRDFPGKSASDSVEINSTFVASDGGETPPIVRLRTNDEKRESPWDGDGIGLLTAPASEAVRGLVALLSELGYQLPGPEGQEYIDQARAITFEFARSSDNALSEHPRYGQRNWATIKGDDPMRREGSLHHELEKERQTFKAYINGAVSHCISHLLGGNGETRRYTLGDALNMVIELDQVGYKPSDWVSRFFTRIYLGERQAMENGDIASMKLNNQQWIAMARLATMPYAYPTPASKAVSAEEMDPNDILDPRTMISDLSDAGVTPNMLDVTTRKCLIEALNQVLGITESVAFLKEKMGGVWLELLDPNSIAIGSQIADPTNASVSQASTPLQPAEFDVNAEWTVAPQNDSIVIDPTLSQSIDECYPQHRTLDAYDALRRFEAGVKEGRWPHPEVVGRLINAMGRKGEVDTVRNLYHHAQTIIASMGERREQQSLAWFQVEDQMTIAFAHAGDLRAAHVHRERILGQGGAPSADAYGAMISGIRDTTDDVSTALALWNESQEHGVVPSLFLYNTIISRLAKARKAEHALELFQQMKADKIAPSTVTYGAVITACCRVGDAISAETLFKEMQESKKYQPRVPPFNTIIQLFTTTRPDRGRVEHYFNLMQRERVPPSDHTYKLLLDAYGTIEPVDISSMERIFDRLQKDRRVNVNSTHWASLINAYGCVQKDLHKAEATFERIGAMVSGAKDSLAYEAIINVLVTHHRTDLFDKYLTAMRDANVHMTAYIANLLIKGYANSGNIGMARDVFESMSDPSYGVAAPDNHTPHDQSAAHSNPLGAGAIVYREPSTWEAMVRAELGANQRDSAVALIGRMDTRGYPPAVLQRVTGIIHQEFAPSTYTPSSPASPYSPSSIQSNFGSSTAPSSV